jgi:putative 4-mercaptohistidine N1-methyltranferase
VSYYESARGLSEYLLFHYGTAEQILPSGGGPVEALDYPLRCVRDTFDWSNVPVNARALEVGCAVGRSTFELARHCVEAVGLDYSENFIACAKQLQQEGQATVDIPVEGPQARRVELQVPPDLDRARVTFAQADAHALPPSLGRFDYVLAANLIDRLSEPRRFLALLPTLVKPGGQLVLTSPYTWLEDYTPREHWLCTETQTTLETLREILAPNFEENGTRELPFLLREHGRKFQWSVAQASLWRRKV